MRNMFVGLISVSLALAAGTAPLYAQGRSSWGGVFTAAQTERGKALFMENCAKCHGESLAGDEMAPQLAGPGFLSNWNGETVGNLTERIRTTMPADNPGKLSAAQATDVAAFILSANQMPAGAADMPRDQPVQQQIKIDALNPAAK